MYIHTCKESICLALNITWAVDILDGIYFMYLSEEIILWMHFGHSQTTAQGWRIQAGVHGCSFPCNSNGPICDRYSDHMITKILIPHRQQSEDPIDMGSIPLDCRLLLMDTSPTGVLCGTVRPTFRDGLYWFIMVYACSCYPRLCNIIGC